MPNATLESKVAELRRQAREILRAKAVNELLQDVQSYTNQVTEAEKVIETTDKAVALLEFSISKLDASDPNYDRKAETLDNDLKDAKNCAEDTTALKGVAIRQYQRTIDSLKKKIADIESGKTLMSNDRITDVTNELIAKGV